MSYCLIDSAEFSALKCATKSYLNSDNVSAENPFLSSTGYFLLFNKNAYSDDEGTIALANSEYLKNPSLSLSKCLKNNDTSSLGGSILNPAKILSNFDSEIRPVLESNILKAS